MAIMPFLPFVAPVELVSSHLLAVVEGLCGENCTKNQEQEIHDREM